MTLYDAGKWVFNAIYYLSHITSWLKLIGLRFIFSQWAFLHNIYIDWFYVIKSCKTLRLPQFHPYISALGNFMYAICAVTVRAHSSYMSVDALAVASLCNAL